MIRAHLTPPPHSQLSLAHPLQGRSAAPLTSISPQRKLTLPAAATREITIPSTEPTRSADLGLSPPTQAGPGAPLHYFGA